MTGGIGVIAEIKRRSPSKPDLAPDLDAQVMARAYENGGATCLSVLTDAPHFGGSPTDLMMARSACRLPVLRKDFTMNRGDVADARLMGADCVLLIVAALTDEELDDLHRAATSVGLDVLVEVHDEPEIERALAIDATMIGVNQRDLATFSVNSGRAAKLAPLLPDGVIRVAESGIKGPDDVRRLADAGYHAALVGEYLVRSSSPDQAVQTLVWA
jgi:indole-3-glycerol phosphate synthase